MRHVQSSQSRKLVIFLQYIKKRFGTAFVLQNIHVFYGDPFMFVFTCLQKKYDGQVYKQLYNHSFIFNSYGIIH